MPVLVGTSGWQYTSWRRLFYPNGLPQRSWLEHYATAFPTVENNSSFYRLPSLETFQNWQARTPDGFVMAVKASRYLTHIKRLQEPAEPVQRFMAAAAGLGARLGPVLIQLPPNLPVVVERLADCLDQFPAGVRIAVEPRHDSWWTDEVRNVLAARDVALCWADVLGRPRTPVWRTASWGYLRMHQGAAKPWPRYGDRALHSWAGRIAEAWPEDQDVYVYFNNDPGGAAVRDAVRFAAIAQRTGLELVEA
jgi:uncharacterized protein YecE (DUF72 family)